MTSKQIGEDFLFEGEKISYGLSQKCVLVANLSFSLKSGQLLLIQGPNGCGKTTFLKVCMGLHPILGGELRSPLKKSEVEFLPQLQNTAIHLPLTLVDILESVETKSFSLSEILKFGLLSSSEIRKKWNSASGGERQKALIIRAFLSDKKLLILDEPFNHLDPKSMAKVQTLIVNYLENGRAILMVSHLSVASHKTIDLWRYAPTSEV